MGLSHCLCPPSAYRVVTLTTEPFYRHRTWRTTLSKHSLPCSTSLLRLWVRVTVAAGMSCHMAMTDYAVELLYFFAASATYTPVPFSFSQSSLLLTHPSHPNIPHTLIPLTPSHPHTPHTLMPPTLTPLTPLTLTPLTPSHPSHPHAPHPHTLTPLLPTQEPVMSMQTMQLVTWARRRALPLCSEQYPTTGQQGGSPCQWTYS